MSTEEIMAIITLPTDETRVKQLRIKLQEYKGRIVLGIGSTGTKYKVHLLEKLLTDRFVDTFAESENLLLTNGTLDIKKFANAAGVIEDYVLTGGQEVFSGTGLPRADLVSSP